MPQPRERQQDQQNQSPNRPGKNPPRQAQDSDAPDKRPNPDRYSDQGKQVQKPSDAHYPEQDPSGKAERPDAVDGAEANRPDPDRPDPDWSDPNRSDRGRNRDDVN